MQRLSSRFEKQKKKKKCVRERELIQFFITYQCQVYFKESNLKMKAFCN